MDTRQKTRSGDPRRQGRSAEQNRGQRSASSGQRSAGSGQHRQKTAAASPRRSESPARRPEQTRRRSSETASRSPQAVTRQRTAQNVQAVRRPEHVSRPVQSDAPEMVFKTDAQQSRRTRSPEENKRAAQRRRSAKRTEERKIEAEKAKKRPAVTYTQPQPLNWNRLLLQLTVVVAVVLAIVMGLSVFFKVETVVVYGNNAYSAWTVQEAAGIEGGENLLTFGNTRACGKIMAELPYVDSVRIGIKLPDTVNIYIEEIDVAYAIQSQDGTWWLMTSGGKVVEQIDGGTASSYTKVLGVELDTPQVGETARAVESTVVTSETTDAAAATEEAPVVVTGAARLSAALQILAALEKNDIVGEAASVDVTSLANIELWYGQQYQVKLGDINYLDKKITSMKMAVAQRNDYDMGIMDCSFTTWPDQVGFTPSE